MKRPPIILALALMATGCTLVDQNTFYPPKPKPVAAKAAPAPVVNDALITVSLADGDPHYQDELADAVKQALHVKPDAKFDVISLVPQKGENPPTLEQAAPITALARKIAEDIQRDGVDTGQIGLGVQATTGLDHGEIRVYVQ